MPQRLRRMDISRYKIDYMGSISFSMRLNLYWVGAFPTSPHLDILGTATTWGCLITYSKISSPSLGIPHFGRLKMGLYIFKMVPWPQVLFGTRPSACNSFLLKNVSYNLCSFCDVGYLYHPDIPLMLVKHPTPSQLKIFRCLFHAGLIMNDSRSLPINPRTARHLASGISLITGSANERRRFIVTTSLISWAHSQNDL